MNPTSSPPHRSLLRQALALCIIDGVASSPLCYLWLPGNFIVAALLTGLFHLSEASYGLVVSLPFWCNFLQIFLTPALARHFAAKSITLAAAWANAAGWLALTAALSFLPRDRPAESTPVFLLFFLGFSLLASINGVAWNSWTQEWSPERIRGKYFGFRNGLIQAATVIFLVLVWAALALFEGSLLALQAVFVLAVALRVWSIVAQHRLKLGATAADSAPALPWRGQFQIIGRNRSLLAFIVFGAIWGFAYNSLGPFYPVFMYNQLGLSLARVCLFIILNTLSAAITMPTWGRLLDRLGNKSVLAAAILLWQAQYFIWIFLDRGNAWLLYGLWIWNGFTWAGFTLGLFNMLLKLIPPEAKTTAIGLNTAVTSIVTAVAPILSGAALTYALRRGWNPMTVYHYAFVIQIAPALLSCIVLLRVHEPKASSLSAVFGAMRNFRTLGAMLGLTFFANYVFVKPARRPPR
ncbi:MAG TPA: MFS transporter [Opitutaceae bacterium]|nr:MFS transporter [Opitutaceae bacterium]